MNWRAKLTPEQLEAYRERRRELSRQRRSTPEGLEKIRAKGRKDMAAYYERHKNDPDFIERKRARQRTYAQTDKGKATAQRYYGTRPSNDHTASEHVESMHRALLSNHVYAAANAAVPRKLVSYLREDVISDICLAVLAGEYSVEDIPQHVRQAIARNRGADSQWADVSLDAPVSRESRKTGHDTIPQEMMR